MTFLDEALTDRITEQAKRVRFSRVALTILAGLLFGLGWLAAKTVTAVWFVLAWCVTAIRVGWQEGRKSSVK